METNSEMLMTSKGRRPNIKRPNNHDVLTNYANLKNSDNL